MLSTRIFSSSSAATKYYSHDDYYGKEAYGNWYGEAAKELGLTGRFAAKNNKSFHDILNGIAPNGQILARKTKEGNEHCPGIDLTFSAPKSFSIQMLVYANKEKKEAMESALTKAVDNTLKYIEKNNYVIARKGHAGIDKESINKLIFAKFLHTTNRNLEPQVHIHCLLANMAKCNDNVYRSISFKNLLKNTKFFGQIFRNELAIETKKLGYEIVPTILSDGSSSFELSKIDNKLIEGFSTRRQEIEALCKLYDVTSKQGRDNIVINSRKSKAHYDQAELSKAWQELTQKISLNIKNEEINELSQQQVKQSNQEGFKQAIENDHKKVNPLIKALNFIIDKFSANISANIPDFLASNLNDNKVNKNNTKNGLENKLAKIDKSNSCLSLNDLAMLCIEDVTYHNSIFSKEDLAKKTLKFGIGQYVIEEIDQEYKRLETSGILIRYKDKFTSKSLLTQEKQILQLAKLALGNAKPILAEEYLAKHIEKFEVRESAKNSKFQLNEQQKQVMKHILLSKNKITTVIGLPGTGKSIVLNAVRDISSHKLNKIMSLVLSSESFEGIAPTGSAAKTLGLSAKIESNTIHMFLSKYQGYLEGRGVDSLKEQRENFQKYMIFVDEASLIPTHIMHKLISLQKLFGFRMVLLGDTKQLAAVEAGKPFTQILSIIPPIRLDIIVRQNQEMHRQAIIASHQDKIKDSFILHKDNIQVKDDLVSSTTSLYLQNDQLSQENTLLISPTRALRDKINDNIRLNLQATGSLKGINQEFIALRQKDMSIADYQFAPSFNVGEIVKFHRSYRNIEKDEYLKVKHVNSLGNSLILSKNTGQNIIYNLRKGVDYKSKFEVFQERKLILQEGLKIIFTKNNRDYNLINSETAIIKQINVDNLLLQFENKLSRKIPISALKHIDYGYCITIHSAQGKTYDNTIAAINTHNLLNEQKSWLVTLSRHRNNLTIFVEDKEQLERNIISNKGNQTSALELQALIDARAANAFQKKSNEENKIINQNKNNTKNKDNARTQIKTTAKENNPYKFTSNNELSAHDIHNLLSQNLIALAQQLLPSLSHKKIIMTKKSIQCGSINIIADGNKKGLWTRFSTNQNGNLFDLISLAKGLNSAKEAVEWSKSYLGVYESNKEFMKNNFYQQSNKIHQLNVNDKKLKKLIPVPEDAIKFNPQQIFYYLLKDEKHQIEAVHEYCNINNELYGYVVRIRDIANNKKKTLPVVYTENNKGKRAWAISGFDNKRCLYNEQKLNQINKSGLVPILIVEGEKTADKATKLYPELTVVSWCGGANGFRKSKWEVLKARDIIIWPDNDKAGFTAAYEIKKILESKTVQVNSCKIINLNQFQALPEKWDLADQLPGPLQRHQITGLLLSEAKIDDNIRINRTIKDYVEYRQIQFQQEIRHIANYDLREYYKAEYKHNAYLINEKKHLSEYLKTSPILDEKSQARIIANARLDACNNIEMEADKYAAKQLWENEKSKIADKININSDNLKIIKKETQLELKF